MRLEVNVKDRKKEVEMLRMALCLSEIGVDYIQADLILKVQERLKEKGDLFSLSDGIEVFNECKEYWNSYFDSKTKV